MLITVMSERELHVPRLGRIVADPGLPAGGGDEPVRRRRHGAHLERRVRPGLPAQRRLPDGGRGGGDRRSAPCPTADAAWVERIVELVRRTRDHPDLRVGSSVRGALDATAVVVVARRAARAAGRRRRRSASTPCSSRCRGGSACARARLRTAEEIITELWDEVFGDRRPSADGDGAIDGKSPGPDGGFPVLKEGPAGRRRHRRRPSGRRRPRRELARHAALRRGLAGRRPARRGGVRRR